MALPNFEVPPMECPAVLLPTPANLTNIWGKLATIPDRLIAAAKIMAQDEAQEYIDMAEDLETMAQDEAVDDIDMAENLETMAQDEAQEYIDMAEDLKSMVEDMRKFFSAYDPKNKKAIFPEKEWEVMITRLLEEYPMYVQTEILSLITTLFPIEFTFVIPGIGISVDLLKLVTDRAYLTELMAEVQGFGTDMEAQIEALKSGEWKDLSPDELQAQIDKLRGDKLDALFALLPDEYKLFNGDYGLETAEWKGKQIIDYIKNEATKRMNQLMTMGFSGLIELFDVIWDALGLPSLPGMETMNAGELIKGVVTAEKAKMAAELASLEEKKESSTTSEESDSASNNDEENSDDEDNITDATKDELKKQMNLGIVEGLKGIEVFGFDVMSLLGGEFNDETFSIEFQVARINQKLKEFEANWQLFLFKTWMQKVTAFFDAIGLGALTQFATLDFCTFIGLMGIPTTIDLSSFSNIKEVATALNPDLKILDTLNAADNASSTFSEVTTTLGQTILGSGDSGSVVVNKSNLLVAFTAYTISGGNIVLDEAAAAGTEYLVIPDPNG